jgi:DNA repair photolyase
MSDNRPKPGQSLPGGHRSGTGHAEGALPGLGDSGREGATPGAAVRAGIARSAASAPAVDARNDVTYSLLSCKSLLSSCQSARVPFQWSINPYRGCEFGCVYCYARYTHEYMELQAWEDFERRIFIKREAGALLEEELRRNRRSGESIAIGTATDPYQPAERRHRVTRSILEVAARYPGLRLSVTTKSDLVLRDLDLLRAIHEGSELWINITVTTLRRDLARILEPRAPRPDLRLRAVRGLADAGLRVNVFLMPILPMINDRPGDLSDLVEAAAAVGARGLFTQVLFLRASSRRRFFPFIREHFPELMRDYRQLYGSAPEALEAYARQINERISALKEQWGLKGTRPSDACARQPPQPAFSFE